MPKRKRVDPPELVPHPRYGSKPAVSGITVPEEVIRQGHWRYSQGKIYPESVLLADPSKQNYSTFPRDYYVDVLRHCRQCERPFIFFAREQRHWFETLKFYVDADCVHCHPCRRASQALHRRLQRYSHLARTLEPSRRELMSLVDDGAYLLAHGVLRKLDHLGRLKNQALKHIPEYKGTVLLVQALVDARNSASTKE